jgi:hypothetical protein
VQALILPTSISCTTCQAGQWSYSLSGLPVSLITGKLTTDKFNKGLMENYNNDIMTIMGIKPVEFSILNSI